MLIQYFSLISVFVAQAIVQFTYHYHDYVHEYTDMTV